MLRLILEGQDYVTLYDGFKVDRVGLQELPLSQQQNKEKPLNLQYGQEERILLVLNRSFPFMIDLERIRYHC